MAHQCLCDTIHQWWKHVQANSEYKTLGYPPSERGSGGGGGGEHSWQNLSDGGCLFFKFYPGELFLHKDFVRVKQ